MEIKAYWNSRRKVYSFIRNGKVLFYSENAPMKNCTFKVSDAARQKVILNKRKSVHAFVIGELCELDTLATGKLRQFTYNPYNNSQFTDVKTGIHLSSAEYCLLTTKDSKPICYYKKDNK